MIVATPTMPFKVNAIQNLSSSKDVIQMGESGRWIGILRGAGLGLGLGSRGLCLAHSR